VADIGQPAASKTKKNQREGVVVTDTRKSEKTYVKNDNTATIICPKCGTSRKVSVDGLRSKQHRIKVRCSCGYVFKLDLEFRRHFRKNTDLQGEYNFETDARHVRIIDLSISGACFEVRGPHDIEPGMKGELVFTLDNRNMSNLYRKVIICTVKGSRIGCEFLNSNTPSRELGFYMRTI